MSSIEQQRAVPVAIGSLFAPSDSDEDSNEKEEDDEFESSDHNSSLEDDQAMTLKRNKQKAFDLP